MSEYIEKEALLLRIDLHGTNKFGMLDEDIREFIKEQPADDVAPVRHGRWVHLGNYPPYCSECEGMAPKDCMGEKYYDSDFCPACGAKMDGGDAGENQTTG